MTKKIQEAEAIELMEQAFCAEADDPVHHELQEVLQAQPEFNPLWEEFQALRQGVAQLESRESPSELTRNRILNLGPKTRGRLDGVKPSGVWRWLLSQPVVAAATVAVFIGMGIYSFYWRQENAPKLQPSVPSQEMSQPLPKSPGPGAQESDQLSDRAPAPARLERGKEEKAEGLKKPAPKPDAAGKRAQPTPSEAPAAVPLQVEGEAAPPSPEPKPLGSTLGGSAPSIQAGDADQMPRKTTEEAPKAKKLKERPEARSQVKDSSLDEEDMDTKTLVDRAKELMEQGRYQEALIALKRAQKIKDTKEIRQLIAQCRAAIMKQ